MQRDVPLTNKGRANALVAEYMWALCSRCTVLTRHVLQNRATCTERAVYHCAQCREEWVLCKEFFELCLGCAIEPGDERVVFTK